VDEQVTFDALHSFASIARELATQPAGRPTVQRVADLAVKVVGCDAAVVGRYGNGRLTIVAATDDQLGGVVERIARSTGSGLSLQVGRQHATVVANDLAHEDRWREALEVGLTETYVRSAVGFHLALDSQDLGTLTLYSRQPNFFTSALVELASVYADHAAIALGLAREHEHVENLTTALETSREIGAAIGIVMHEYGIDDAAAFDVLRVASQRSNRKLRELAEEIVSGGNAAVVRGFFAPGRVAAD
jgi:GAF domain-containing protein